MKKLKNNIRRFFVLITTSSELYRDFDKTNEVLDIDEYKGGVVDYKAMLESNQRVTLPFFTKLRRKDLDVFCLFQSYFDLPKKNKNN